MKGKNHEKTNQKSGGIYSRGGAYDVVGFCDIGFHKRENLRC